MAMFDTKNNFVFSLYGTLVDIRTDENLPYLWSSMARYYSMKGASYDEVEFREEYSRLCREHAEASAKKSKKGKSKLKSVGLNSIPTWCRPRNVLSTGEGFRADLALNLESKVMIDEYTSVVNRECAMSTSNSVQKYIRRNGIKNVIFCGCHYDIIPMLKPDILVDLNTGKVYDLRGFRLGKASTSPSSKFAGTRSERSGKYLLRITI
jgi:hypothetical protein